jgi:hypothetical protein
VSGPFGRPEAPPRPDPVAPADPAVTPFRTTPNAERHLLAAESLRRRQLGAALLHGSRLTWRERRRLWPAVLAGLGVAAVIIAVIAVSGAFQRQKRIDEEQERQRNQPRPGVSAPASVQPSASVPVSVRPSASRR